MMYKPAVVCKETFITTGTGDITLGGAVGVYQAFASELVDADTSVYLAADAQSLDAATNWELGVLTYHAGNTLSRSVWRSTNGNLAVSWAGGTKYLWGTSLDAVGFVAGARPADISDVVAALGGDSYVQGIYDARYNLVSFDGAVVDNWGDARGEGYGLVLTATGTTRPAYSVAAKTITFDGVNDRLTNVSSALFNYGGTAKAIAYIGSNPAPGNVANLSSSDVFGIVGNAGLIQAQAGGSVVSSTIATSATRRLSIASKDLSTALHIDVPDHVRVSATVAASTTEYKLLEVGAIQGTGYTAAVVRAVVILARAATANDIAILRAWAVRYHGITAA